MEPEDPVDNQLAAYNRHDVDAFAACYAPDAEVRAADGRLLMRGRDEIRDRYTQLFAEHPDVSAEVPNRIRAGDWIIDEEQVQRGHEQFHVAVGYEIRDGLIRSVVMMRSES